MSGEKRKRRSRKSKEEKLLEKMNKEEEEQKQQQQEQQTTNAPTMTPEDLKTIMDNNSSINEKMMNMDVRIKYGFIKTLYNNLISINLHSLE